MRGRAVHRAFQSDVPCRHETADEAQRDGLSAAVSSADGELRSGVACRVESRDGLSADVDYPAMPIRNDASSMADAAETESGRVERRLLERRELSTEVGAAFLLAAA